MGKSIFAYLPNLSKLSFIWLYVGNNHFTCSVVRSEDDNKPNSAATVASAVRCSIDDLMISSM